LANWKSFNDIKIDSTTPTSDAPTETLLKNEKGGVITATSVAGTNKFEFICCNSSATMLLKMLKATDKTPTFAADDLFAVGSTVHGFGASLPVIEAPIGFINDVSNQMVLYPKAKITSLMIMDTKTLAIKVTATAQSISTAAFEDVMIIRGALDVNNA